MVGDLLMGAVVRVPIEGGYMVLDEGRETVELVESAQMQTNVQTHGQ